MRASKIENLLIDIYFSDIQYIIREDHTEIKSNYNFAVSIDDNKPVIQDFAYTITVYSNFIYHISMKWTQKVAYITSYNISLNQKYLFHVSFYKLPYRKPKQYIIKYSHNF